MPAFRLAPLLALALLSGGAKENPPPPTWYPATERAALPQPLPIRVVPAADGPTAPPAPDRVTGAGAIGRTLAGGLGGGLAGLGYGGAAGIAGGPLGIVAGAGAGAAIGIVVGLVAGGIESGRAMHSEAEAAQAATILLRHLDPERARACLAETLISRSAGRMIGAEPDAKGHLTIGLEELSLMVETPEPAEAGPRRYRIMPFNPPMRLHLQLHSPPRNRPEAAEAPGTGDWSWSGPGSRYFDWAARDGAALQEQLEIGIGIVAQTILADLYPADFQRPPRQGAEALRTRCPAPPTEPRGPVIIRATGAAEETPAR
jgi:hypothetical protein